MTSIEYARQALKQGNLPECLQACKTGLQQEPGQASLFRLLAAHAFLRLSDLPSARIELARVALNMPTLPELNELIRQLGEATAEWPENIIDQALWELSNSPYSFEPCLALAKAWAQLDEQNLAEQFLNRALQLASLSSADLVQVVGYCRSVGKLEKALLASYWRSQLDPNDFLATLDLTYDAINVCDWRQYDYLQAALRRDIERGAMLVGETGLASHALDARLQLLSAQRRALAIEREAGGPFPPMALPLSREGRPLRVGFVGADFHRQATAYLFTGVVEAWKAHFSEMQIQAIAYDHGPSDQSELRARIDLAYEAIVPIHQLSDQQAAERVMADQIDILVLMKGIGSARMGIFARRPAPVQVFYLYYPGTSGAPYIDYFVADDVVIPPSHEAFYQETIVRLPRCYQPNDHRRALPIPCSRQAAGLPDNAFIFANFNQCYKLTPHHFKIWCAILQACPNAILWLLDPGELAKVNLREQMRFNGVSPDRLYFGRPLDTQDHLSRLCCADLLLDSYPYGAHTGTSDALWAGLPVLTLMGDTFASRVAASLLTSVGLPNLITQTAQDYVDKACAAARGQLPLAQWRDHLQSQRHQLPLFDTVGYARDFAALLHAMAAT
jgi:predicted O-linked N-acetylglucosamine transferase (SPINDLY family)